MIKSIAFVAYSVSDVARAAAFYRDTIGLKPSRDAFGDHWVEFDVGDTAFGVGNGESAGIAPGSAFSAAFEVDDVAGMRKSLREKGVEVTDLMDAPPCTSCFVTDPDGNRFALHQRK